MLIVWLGTVVVLLVPFTVVVRDMLVISTESSAVPAASTDLTVTV